ncbi:M56 family metallopeptidase [Thermoanaerobacterium thermosaccharolyticum]|uniref:M56 family metallopeptidase n=1 Tax=Thermoanaerobacterium thermosaccharolyticum TaxID=1517 RepID=UPI003DA8E1A7
MIKIIYNQLLIMSVVAGGLYLILKLLSLFTFKYFSSTWHYYSYIFMYMFFLIPYHRLVSWLNLSFAQYLSWYISSAANGIATSRHEIHASISLYLDLIPYTLMAGTLVATITTVVQNYTQYKRIFSMCRLANDTKTLNVFLKCKQEMLITKDIKIYISSCMTTPFLYGIFKPRIVLPDIEFTKEELRHIYLHELTHWKRHDPCLKFLFLLINLLHWFNPLAYIARHDIENYCELSCDESVVKSMDSYERRRYCKLILNVLWNVVNQNVKLFSAFIDKRKQLERRLNRILDGQNSPYRQKKRWVVVSAILITLLIAIVGTGMAYATDEVISVAGETSISVSSGGVEVTPQSHTDMPFLVEGETSISAPSQ